MALPPPYLVALITPFDRSGELDLDAHRHNLERLWQAGITGYVLGGSNGEGPYLEPGERATLTRTARETLGDEASLVCGVMAETVRQALAQAAEATQGGADAVLVLTPTTLTRGRPDAVLRFFSAVADSSPLPVILYSVPPTTVYSLEEEIVAELADRDTVVGMKDSSGDPVRLQRLVHTTPDGFPFWAGSSQALTLSVTAGAYGAITGSGNYAPRLVLNTLAQAQRNPLEAAGLQRRLSSLARAIEGHGVAGVKAASEEVGLRPGLPRDPLRPLDGELAKELRSAVAAI